MLFLIKLFKQLYRKIPIQIRWALLKHRNPERYKLLKMQREQLFKSSSLEERAKTDIEIRTILRYCRKNFDIFIPYDFTKKYMPENVKVYIDGNSKYVLFLNKRMYFPEKFTKEMTRFYFASVLREQDLASPHRYESENFAVQEDDIVADVGAAEGIFALSVIEKVKKIYLFECEEKWLEPLQKTFAPWSDKVEIIHKYVSDYDSSDNMTLDAFCRDGKREINFIKADIEGAEIAMLKGARDTLVRQKKLRLALCAYHRETDAEDLREILENNRFQVKFSAGYLIPYMGGGGVRRGILRATKGA
jgi:hypothetical protein